MKRKAGTAIANWPLTAIAIKMCLELVSGNWPVTAMVMDRFLETGQWQQWIGVWKLAVDSYGHK